jgi:ABC-2 type transport system ATP-binding protein
VLLSAADGAARVRGVIAELRGVREVAIDGQRLTARADDGAAAVPAVLAALDQAGVPATAVTVARPSLDDVYLRYAGRRFSDAELAAVGGAR